MRLRLFIRIICIVVIATSCTANRKDYEIIETRTNLTTIEIINYIPNSISLSQGYTKQTLNKVDIDTYSKIDDAYSSADLNNHELYFDSLAYELIKRIDKLNYIDQIQITTLINSRNLTSSNNNQDPNDTDLSFIGVVPCKKNKLLATLEIPKNQKLNWSIVKIWKYDSVTNRVQIHSILKANSNSFDHLDFKGHNIHLSDDNFVYRLVLDNEYRFEKDMDIFVSVDIDESI